MMGQGFAGIPGINKPRVPCVDMKSSACGNVDIKRQLDSLPRSTGWFYRSGHDRHVYPVLTHEGRDFRPILSLPVLESRWSIICALEETANNRYRILVGRLKVLHVHTATVKPLYVMSVITRNEHKTIYFTNFFHCYEFWTYAKDLKTPVFKL